MGTRADFYVRKDAQMKWLGSKAYDGYPSGIRADVLNAATAEDFERRVQSFLGGEDDATFPEEGWPWPWDDSRTTDYAYIFEDAKVMASSFGRPLFDPLQEEPDQDGRPDMDGYFPNMAEIKNVKFGGPASGIMVFSAPKE